MSRMRVAVVAAVAVAAGLVAPPAQAAWTCFGKVATIVGTDRDNTIKGTRGPDVIWAGRGDDTVYGRGGNDRICGGSGEDRGLYGNKGNDKIDAGTSERATFLYGGAGNDLLYEEPGGGDAQEMFGGPGDDVLKAGDSNGTYLDVLDGGPGDDVMEQGRAEGIFFGGDGNDVMRGGKWNGDRDELRLDAAPGPVDVDLARGTIRGWGNDTVEEIEIVWGSELDDTLTGDSERNYLIGRAGDDTISGGGGDDCALGGTVQFWNSCWFPYDYETGSGNDTLNGDAGDDGLIGGDGNDLVDGGSGFDTKWFAASPAPVTVDLGGGVATGEGSDTLAAVEGVVGSNFADTLTGSAGADSLTAGLQGPNGPPGYQGTGGDVMRGLGGDDVLDVIGGVDADGGEGSDTVTYRWVGLGEMEIDLREDSDSSANTLTSIENVVGPPHDSPSTIHGDDATNALVGSNGNDEIFGHGGDDSLDGSWGDDVLDGGEGNDRLDGGPTRHGGRDTCTNGETVVDCEE